MHLNILDIFVLFVVGFWIQRFIRHRRRNVAGLPLPPGPPGFPLLGNLFDFPKTDAWLTGAQWGKTYGSLVYLKVLGRPIIFSNTYEATMDLLDKRSLIYSSRPNLPMLRELMGWDWSISLMPYGPTLQKRRMFLHQFLNRNVMGRHHNNLAMETHQMVLSLIDSPDNYLAHVRRATGAIIMMIAYGHKVGSQGDRYVKLADEALATMSTAGEPGAFLVNFVPSLQYVPEWFPGAGFKRKAKAWRKLSQAMLNDPYEMTKRKILEGTARSSMTSDLVEHYTTKDGHVDGEDDIAASAAVAYAGGSDTTVSAIISFLLALVLYPDVQTRGQEELDRVVGTDRLPTFDDRPTLPYIEGILKETLRWNPVVPGGAPHLLEKDDVYNGYFIPAGSIVLPNQWAMLHDETEYPEPSLFLPERWILKKGQKEPRHPSKVTFGFGRRICPGKELVEDSLYITIVSILATLNVQKAKDAQGEPITPPGRNRKGLVSHPEPFKCAITPRSPEAVAMIRHAIETEQ
ncbi:hypothetical protein PILCRDRAFT_812637 [Piloderma croceum F 1598]|uniref:Cytochrome P450 n=1 Tax=Piloderma croceum (strain F 1598) TaxID=765440 RepID=A0A0C3GGT4_PILCF|nr:hypothetical protein PILCRDRAFT_812637 [Piloderma croceum F 1598]